MEEQPPYDDERSALALGPGQDKMIYRLVKSTLTASEKGV